MKPITLNSIDKLEKVLSSITEEGAWCIFLPGHQAVQVTDTLSGALRNVPHVPIGNFFLFILETGFTQERP